MRAYRPGLVMMIIGAALIAACLWISGNHAAVAWMRDSLPSGMVVFLVLLYLGAGVVFVGAIRLVKAWLAERRRS